MNSASNNPNRRRVTATMTRGKSKDIIEVRYFNYFDTAMPRMLQLAITRCNAGDFIEFTSVELGFQLGILHILPRGRFEMVMNPIVKSSPSLLKLMTEDTNWNNPLITSAMRKAS